MASGGKNVFAEKSICRLTNAASCVNSKDMDEVAGVATFAELVKSSGTTLFI